MAFRHGIQTSSSQNHSSPSTHNHTFLPLPSHPTSTLYKYLSSSPSLTLLSSSPHTQHHNLTTPYLTNTHQNKIPTTRKHNKCATTKNSSGPAAAPKQRALSTSADTISSLAVRCRGKRGFVRGRIGGCWRRILGVRRGGVLGVSCEV